MDPAGAKEGKEGAGQPGRVVQNETRGHVEVVMVFLLKRCFWAAHRMHDAPAVVCFLMTCPGSGPIARLAQDVAHLVPARFDAIRSRSQGLPGRERHQALKLEDFNAHLPTNQSKQHASNIIQQA